jgi:hypothetical protein
MVFLRFPHTVPSPHRIFDKVIRLRAGRFGVRMPAWVRIFFLLRNDHTASGAHLASCSMGKRFLTPGAKRSTPDVHHSSLLSAEVKNEWSSTSAATVCINSKKGAQCLLPVH